LSHLVLLSPFDLVASVRTDQFVQQTLNGLTLGAVYALIALGYSMVYGVLKLLNFAHGDVYMVGAFIGFGMMQWLGFRGAGGAWAPVISTWFVLLVVFGVAMIGTAGLGVAIERFAYRPLRNAPRIAPLISALGVSFFIAYSMQLMFGAQQRDYNVFGIDNGKLFLSGFTVPGTGVNVPLVRIIIILSAVVLMFALWVLVTRTRTGKAMRATSYDREAAAMMGIDIDKVIVFTFVLGSALAGAAGVMFALRAPASVTMGFIAGLKGFTAAVIGGIGSIPGAMGGGFILGLAEAYTQGYVSSQWSDLFVFVILIGFMLFRPQGLFGKADINKV
jgi:branched-chain amino acid transport system permease protein